MLVVLDQQCLSSPTFIQIISADWKPKGNELYLVGVAWLANALATKETCGILERTKKTEIMDHSEDGKVYSCYILKR